MNFIISEMDQEALDWNNINLNMISKKKCFIFNNFNTTLSDRKTIIDSKNYNSEWDKMKKIANPFELIYTTYSKKKRKESIANYQPISRSFFKFWEMNVKFNLIDLDLNEHYVANLAEGPGGFMEAIIKQYYHKNIKLFGLTLPPHNKYIPDWSKIKHIFTNKVMYISYGDLYKWNDIEKYIDNFKNKKCSLVTADGGFDYSNNFNGQEIDSYKILFSEIFVSFLILLKGGNFVCKFFDLFSIFSIKLIFILTKCFEQVNIYKPETSRPANSEKYLICKGFIGLTKDMKNKIIELFKKIESIPITKCMVLDIKGINFNNDFIHKINDMNSKYLDNQIFFINKIVDYIDENQNNKLLINNNKIVLSQVKNAIEWCNKNKMKVNKDSEYFIKYNTKLL
jgi:cap1 methyltransferase